MVVYCSTQWDGSFDTKFMSLVPCVRNLWIFKGHRPQISPWLLKSIKFDSFCQFWWLKRQTDTLCYVILVMLMETHRLVPWLRQLDHPIQKYHAPRARAGKYKFSLPSQRFLFNLCHPTFSRVNHTCLTHCNRFQMPHYPISPSKIHKCRALSQFGWNR